MAWRLEEVVEHGLIDNTVEGTTTGKIWLVGRDEPLILSLNGDCWRDLAGTVLEFENPEPSRESGSETDSLDTEQTGIIGDMTASRRARVPTISDEEISQYMRDGREVPCKWQNLLYLEWFSEINGRMLIETVAYKLRISDRQWDMDVDAEEAQKLANLSAMRDFLAQVIRRIEPDEHLKTGKRKPDGEKDEFQWEEHLKASDRISDAYQEVLEKYMEDSDSERKEAFVMGWDGLLGSMADYDEGLDDVDFDFEDEDDDDEEDDASLSWMSAADDDDGDDDEMENEDHFGIDEAWEKESHPLQTKARELTLRAMNLVMKNSRNESPAESLVSNLTLVSGKLAGVLHGYAKGYQLEKGFILAVLKRCLNWINETLGACTQLIESEEDSDQKTALSHLKNDIFTLRDGITELQRELKQN